jgi:hypothetical protein
MMRDMRRRLLRLLPLAAVLLWPAAAAAQFYDLDGVYRCLKASDAACEEGLRERPERHRRRPRRRPRRRSMRSSPR